MSKHSISDFLEACDVSTCNVVVLYTVFFSSVVDVVEDVDHDVFEFSVNFLECPAVTHAVLAHFKSGCCNSAGIGSLARYEVDMFLKIFCCIKSSRHVGTFSNNLATVSNKLFSIFKEELVLSCTRKSDINRNLPYAAAFVVFRLWSVFLVFCQTCALYFFDLFQRSNIDAFRAKAKAIVAYREANGNFSSIEDLRKVPGIKEGVFGQVQSLICVN